MTDTSRESVERIRKYVDYPYTYDDVLILDSALVKMTAGDLRALLTERDAFKARADRAEADAEKWKKAFAVQSRKLQTVLHIDGVKSTLAKNDAGVSKDVQLAEGEANDKST